MSSSRFYIDKDLFFSSKHPSKPSKHSDILHHLNSPLVLSSKSNTSPSLDNLQKINFSVNYKNLNDSNNSKNLKINHLEDEKIKHFGFELEGLEGKYEGGYGGKKLSERKLFNRKTLKRGANLYEYVLKNVASNYRKSEVNNLKEDFEESEDPAEDDKANAEVPEGVEDSKDKEEDKEDEKSEEKAEKEEEIDPDLADLSEDSDLGKGAQESIMNRPRVEFYDVLDKTIPLIKRNVEIDRKLAKRGIIPKHSKGGWIWRKARFISEQSSADGKKYTWKLEYVDFPEVDLEDKNATMAKNPKLQNFSLEKEVEIVVPDEEFRLADAETKSSSESILHDFKVGDKLDILDFFKSRKTGKMVQKWRESEITAVDKYWIRVHFIGWADVWDEWFHIEIQRLRIASFAKMSQKNARMNRRRIENFKKVLARKKKLQLVEMLGDGNCLFRTVAHQVYGTAARHAKVRYECCTYMLQNQDRFSQVVGDVKRHVRKMKKPQTWGDDPEIRAMEELYDRRMEIYAVTGNGANVTPMIIHFKGDLPEDLEDDPIRMSYHGQCHYNSIVPLDLKMAKDKSYKIPKNKLPKIPTVSRLNIRSKPLELGGKIKQHRDKILLEAAEAEQKRKQDNEEKEKIEKLKKKNEALMKDEDEEKADESEEFSQNGHPKENGDEVGAIEKTDTSESSEKEETPSDELKKGSEEDMLSGEEMKKLRETEEFKPDLDVSL